jgi:hypothetical protein
MPPCEFCGDELPELLAVGVNPGTCWWNAEDELYRLGPAEGRVGTYVEGWAVRERNGVLEPFEHGWVELDGVPRHVTPHHHAVAYFGGIRSEHPRRDFGRIGVTVPLYRDLTRRELDGGQPNPHFD